MTNNFNIPTEYLTDDEMVKLGEIVNRLDDLNKRLGKHNKGIGAKSTRGRFWKIIYSEKCLTRGEAISREYYIKKDRKFRIGLKKGEKSE